MTTPELQSEAIVVWTGWKQTAWPARDERRLVEHFGRLAAAELLPVVRQLADEFYASDAHSRFADLAEMGSAAGERFKRMHPEISDEAINAFVWCYTFDYR
jgi:hypothetical protein